ncbi:2-amino-thiazoline-4-carboxylic acid hydrolase [Roseococcus sp. SYP-B2431]|uniref:L-2-amino-thiazoline-4-carboxylic acid hydrolase n=1 Tax=Roseococcus sp. SYP-B2431 TaxID=2496640 RepID=UPI00103A94C9|nr:L-2-amino-thiazoline-4-carboxylic acid hydrolase [Roseococcus sp. SYP-B2431]TCI00808.1 2-amino-thiazoline-4-carboxylic acid hydrolase [Roseococcus sp. SYP-B2431]
MTVSILEQRRIEAAFAKGIYEEMAAALGEEQATAILTSAVVKLARQTGATMAREAPEPSIAHFAELMERWKLDDALRIEVLREDEEHFDFNVTRCRYAESYREMGLGKLGAVLSCNRDGAFCEGYDPRMKLERTQTIMSGSTHCNFRYTRAP